jgi:DNA invertase Pin-like site-specific DNA recombinase
LAAQVMMQEAAGCEEIVREHASAVGRREAFEILRRNKLRGGDIPVVIKMDRRARSIGRLLTIVEALTDKDVDLMILDFSKGESINTNSPAGKLMLALSVDFVTQGASLESQYSFRSSGLVTSA